MHFRFAATFALVSFLSLVLAVPSTPLTSQPAPWRRLSNFLIEFLWGAPHPKAPKSKGRLNAYNGHHYIAGNALARYGSDVVLRFNVTSERDVRGLADAADALFLDVWDYTEDWVDLRLAKDDVSSLLSLLPDSLQSAYATLLDGRTLSKAISDSYPSPPSSKPSTLPGAGHSTFSPLLNLSPAQSEGNIFFVDYQPLSVIVPWMRLLASMFTTHVRLISIGKTFEGRDIPAFRVGNHPTNNDEPSKPRKTVVVMGGSHGREWISVSSVTYLAYWFITQYGKSQPTTGLVEAFDFVFIPTINPDGYVYTWDTDRLWRKNRQTTPLRFCHGVDLDRSWGFKWDGNATRENPCSESYAGDEPFEGVEAEQLQSWARNETEQGNVEFVAFLDLHSYSQQVLYPYSFSCDADPPSLEDLEELALGLAKALRMHGGHYYKAASACEGNVVPVQGTSRTPDRKILPRMETRGGSAIDWFLHELHVKYSYQIKLRDTGSYGFLLPKENIIPSGKEVVEAVMYLGRYMMGEIGLKQSPEASVKLYNPFLSRPLAEVAKEDEVDSANEAPEDLAIQWELRRKRRK